MIVWIINPYGSLPYEGWQKYRSTMIADCLSKHGIEVHHFISNFEHRSKKFRTDAYHSYVHEDSYRIHIIPSLAYSNHISLQRAVYERHFAKNVIRYSKGLSAPHLVVLAEPALFYYNILLSWIKDDLKAKILVDIIDIWPELFELVFPKRLSSISKHLMYPLYYWRRRLYKSADSLVAVSKDYLAIGMALGDFSEGHNDIVYWGYPSSSTAKKNDGSNSVMIDELIRCKTPNEVWGVYAGTLGENYDLDSLFRAVKLIDHDGLSKKVKIIIAGDGPLKQACEEWSDNKTAFFVGRLGGRDLAALLAASDFAFSTYKGKSTVSMPIKAYDYFAHGLPLINSLERELGFLVESRELGINYLSEDVNNLKDAIVEMVNNNDMRNRFQVNCLELAADFNEQVQYTKFYNVVINTLNASKNTQGK